MNHNCVQALISSGAFAYDGSGGPQPMGILYHTIPQPLGILYNTNPQSLGILFHTMPQPLGIPLGPASAWGCRPA